jgi:hypothetical protein
MSTLLCTGCRRHKARTYFRETPWHGRAAACIRCETFPGPAGRSLWQLDYDARTQWQLEQTRQKLRAYQRYAQALRLQRLLSPGPSSADAFRAYEQPYADAVERHRQRWTSALSWALSKAHTLSGEDFK